LDIWHNWRASRFPLLKLLWVIRNWLRNMRQPDRKLQAKSRLSSLLASAVVCREHRGCCTTGAAGQTESLGAWFCGDCCTVTSDLATSDSLLGVTEYEGLDNC
jgi:hypothetical protein